MTNVNRCIPVLVCEDIAATHDYLVDVFGFEPGGVDCDGDGNAVHGEVRTRDGAVWLHRVAPEYEMASPRTMPASHAGLTVYVDDVDAHYAHAKENGARVESEPKNQDYGQREYGARTPDGHRFWFATPLVR